MFTQQDADRISDQISEGIGRRITVELLEMDRDKDCTLLVGEAYNFLIAHSEREVRMGMAYYEIDFHGRKPERYGSLDNAVKRIITMFLAGEVTVRAAG